MIEKQNVKRSIPKYIAFTVITILLGLFSRSQLVTLPVFISEYAGDTLWALMVFWGFCVLRPGWKTWKIALVALLFSFAIEISQLYHAPWIDNIRHTRLGALVLGFGFKWSDLACYSIGVATGFLFDLLLFNPDKKR